MKRMHRYVKRISIMMAILFIISSMPSFNVFAGDDEWSDSNDNGYSHDSTEINYGDEATLVNENYLDGSDSSSEYSEDYSDDTSTSSQAGQSQSGTSKKTVQPDVANTYALKNAIQSNSSTTYYGQWINQIKNTANYTDGNWFGRNNHSPTTRNISYISVPNSDIADLLNKNTDYKNSLTTDSNYMDTNEAAPSNYNDSTAYEGDSDYGSMSSGQQNAIKTGIVLTDAKGEDGSDENITNEMPDTLQDENVGFQNSTGDITVKQNHNGTVSIDMNNNYNKSSYTRNGSNYSHPRQDAVDGGNTKLSINTDGSYWRRLTPLYQIAYDEGWDTEWKNGTKYYKTRGYGTSSALNDETYIGLLTEYTIQTVKKDVVTNVDYTSDERRWTVYLEGEQVCEPLITENPLHELNFTEIYQNYGAGEYYVVCDQLALCTKATYVQYDKCEYLFEMSTGTILWFRESKVTDGTGKSAYLQSKTTDTPEWVETGDTYTVRVNENGEIETDADTSGSDDSGSKRTD